MSHSTILSDGSDIGCPKGGIHSFVQNEAWRSRLMRGDDLFDETAGFLYDAYFAIRLELRFQLPENESFSVSTDETSFHYTVRCGSS